MTSSAMLVAWSPMRSRCRETRIRSSAGSIVVGILEHVGEQLAEDLRLQRCRAGRPRSARAAPASMSRRTNASSASRSIVWAMVAIRGMSISFLTGGVRRVAARRFGDVDRQIADALEVGVDLHGGDDRPEVGGHRLVERQQREAAVVDLDVQAVERLVADEHAVDQRRDRDRPAP